MVEKKKEIFKSSANQKKNSKKKIPFHKNKRKTKNGGKYAKSSISLMRNQNKTNVRCRRREQKTPEEKRENLW